MENLINAPSKVVGTKQVLRVLKAGTALRAYVANDSDTFLFQRIVTAAEAARVYVASDIDTFLYQKVTRACAEANVPVIKVESAKELGRACSLTINCAAAAVCK